MSEKKISIIFISSCVAMILGTIFMAWYDSPNRNFFRSFTYKNKERDVVYDYYAEALRHICDGDMVALKESYVKAIDHAENVLRLAKHELKDLEYRLAEIDQDHPYVKATLEVNARKEARKKYKKQYKAWKKAIKSGRKGVPYEVQVNRTPVK
jgi:hypothetical protein